MWECSQAGSRAGSHLSRTAALRASRSSSSSSSSSSGVASSSDSASRCREMMRGAAVVCSSLSSSCFCCSAPSKTHPSAMLLAGHGSPCSELGQVNGKVLLLSTTSALRGAGKQGGTWARRLRRGSSEALMTTGGAMAVTSASSSSDASSSDSASACFSLYQSGALPGQYPLHRCLSHPPLLLILICRAAS